MGCEPRVRPGSPESLLPIAAAGKQQPVGPEEGRKGACGLFTIRAWWGAEVGRITEDGQVLARGPWLGNSGKRGQTWPLCPGLP